VPYLTPDDIPEDGICRPLSIPASTDWLAFFGGALTELTKTYNWQQWGAVSVDDTVAKMQDIIDAWYAEACSACETPGGYRVIRIGDDGYLQELDDNGDWVTPTGDYVIPPPEAREGGTEQDQICLAAANAVNVLEQLYESLSESWGGAVDQAEALTLLIGVETAILGFAIAPIVWGIYAFFVPIFAALYSLLEFVTADLWDDDVSKQITCFLVECGINDGGVVTFDYVCFTEKLHSLANGFSLTADQLRLYAQVAYLIYFIGGEGGLNLAGGTTEITEYDCDECTHCHVWEGSALADWEIFCCFGDGGDRGHYDIGELFSDNGTEAGGAPNSTELMTRIVFPSPAVVTSIKIQFGATLGSFEPALGSPGFYMIYDSANGWYNGTHLDDVPPTQASPWVWEGAQSISSELTLWMTAAQWSNAGLPSGSFGSIDVYSIRICFDGDDPFDL